jgi:predicted permease
MRWLYKLPLRLRSLLRRGRVEQELSDELRFHLEKLMEENVGKGMTPDEARYAALSELGRLEQIKEECRDMRQVNYIENFIQDVRYAARQLRRSPGFTIVALITLALGIGANAAIFSVVNAVVLRPLPYSHSDRLVWIAEILPAFKAELASGGDYVDWKDQNQTLEHITAYDESASFNLTGRGTPERVHAAQVSASFFATLGVEPQLGRGFTPDEDQPNGRNSVILMHAFWQQYFGSDPQVLGQTVTLNATPYTVVGVMPGSFRFPGGGEVQMLLPLQLNEASERLRVQNTLVRIIGLLKPGVPVARAHADLDAIRKRMHPAPVTAGPSGPEALPPPGAGQNTMIRFTRSAGLPPSSSGGAENTGHPPGGPGSEARTEAPPGSGPTSERVAQVAGTTPEAPRAQAGPPQAAPAAGGGHRTTLRLNGPEEAQIKVTTLAEHLAGNLRPAMLTLLGAVGLVLLIACANVANLMLTRGFARYREVAVRAVLGAGRWRLVRQLLVESVILALAGGLAGLLLAAWGVDVMRRLIPPGLGGNILNVAHVGVDSHVLLFALGVSVATGILFGLAPALAATRLDLVERLKEAPQVAGARGRRGLLRGALVVVELSLALVLLIGASLLIKSFYRVLSIDPGFVPERVLTLNVSLTDSRYPNPEQRRAFFSEVLGRVESLPGVRSAALADSLPLNPYQTRMMIRRQTNTGAGSLPLSTTTVQMSRITVSPAYFYTLGIPLLKGRTFSEQDNEQAPKVAVVNQTLARHLWPNEDPLGKELPFQGSGPRVVGVVGDTRHDGLSEDVQSEFYVPYLQDPPESMQLAVRTVADPASLTSAVRGQITAIDPEQPIYHVATLEQTLSESVAPRRFNMTLLGIFAALALVLATVGVYGVMAFSVTQRTHEIGVRMALGAEPRDVLGLIVRQGVTLTLAGVMFGIGGAWALTRFLAGFLYAVRPTDPVIFLLVSAVLVAVSILASYIPARRATKVDPMVALRYE